jgi:peptide/nickel transport system substrate-binding protein
MVLKEPYGMVLESLGKSGSSIAAIMREKDALTDPQQQVKESVGSGPYVFAKDLWVPGSKAIYLKNKDYIPRTEAPSSFAGAKIPGVDRVELVWISDPQTAMSALVNGEIDFYEAPTNDFLPILEKSKGVKLMKTGKIDSTQGFIRLNHLHPPFDNVKARQAAMYSIAQEDFLRAQVGDPEIYRLCNAPLVCGSKYEKDYGNLLIKPDFEKSKALLKEAGYDGKPIVMMHQTDLQSSNQLPAVGKQLLEKGGFKVDVQSTDWQTVVSRRARKEAPDKGGWNVFYTTTTTVDADNPAANSFSSGGCDKAWFGWPCDPEIEKLRSSFARETDPAKQKALAIAVQDRIMEQAQYIVLGQYKAFGAYRKDRVDGWLQAPVAVWWNISKK